MLLLFERDWLLRACATVGLASAKLDRVPWPTARYVVVHAPLTLDVLVAVFADLDAEVASAAADLWLARDQLPAVLPLEDQQIAVDVPLDPPRALVPARSCLT
jgi:hypothetical protein